MALPIKATKNPLIFTKENMNTASTLIFSSITSLAPELFL